MLSRDEIKQVKREREKPVEVWGLIMAFYSILYGQFFIRHNGYLIAWAEPYMRFLPENWIGVMLILFGGIKIIGIVRKSKLQKRIGIWGLSAIWGGLMLVAFLFSFGTGYPSAQWIDKLLVVVICWRISLKGDFYPYDT